MADAIEFRRRRQALQIAAQLPENREDALAVLKLAAEIIDMIEEPPPTLRVVTTS
jgi:hypothetical protein